MVEDNGSSRPRPGQPGYWGYHSKLKRARRIAAGLCAGCGKARDGAGLSCSVCLAKMAARSKKSRLRPEQAKPAREYPDYHPAAYKRKRRAERQAKGLCTGCGAARDTEGRKRCSSCLAKGRESLARTADGVSERRRRRYAGEVVPVPGADAPRATEDIRAWKQDWRGKRRASDRCTTCGGERDVPGKVRCAACQAADRLDHGLRGGNPEVARAYAAKLRKQRRGWEAEGKCTWCGGGRDRPGKRRCQECTTRGAADMKAQRVRRKRKGLCPTCGAAFTGHRRTCLACLAARREEYRKDFAANPEKWTARSHRRRARKAAAEGTFTAEEWLAIKEGQDFRCLMCGRREPDIKLTVDHVVPLSKGGGNYAHDLQSLCESCNQSKGTRHIDLRHRLQHPRWWEKISSNDLM